MRPMADWYRAATTHPYESGRRMARRSASRAGSRARHFVWPSPTMANKRSRVTGPGSYASSRPTRPPQQWSSRRLPDDQESKTGTGAIFTQERKRWDLSSRRADPPASAGGLYGIDTSLGRTSEFADTSTGKPDSLRILSGQIAAGAASDVVKKLVETKSTPEDILWSLLNATEFNFNHEQPRNRLGHDWPLCHHRPRRGIETDHLRGSCRGDPQEALRHLPRRRQAGGRSLPRELRRRHEGRRRRRDRGGGPLRQQPAHRGDHGPRRRRPDAPRG